MMYEETKAAFWVGTCFVIVIITFFLLGIRQAVIDDRHALEVRCHASLIMAKSASDTLKFVQADNACLQFTTPGGR